MPSQGRAVSIQQVSLPNGPPTHDNFAVIEQPFPELEAGCALVENLLLSVDPYMRECMDGDWDLNAPLEGRTIGRVLSSADDRLAEGDIVFHREGWRTHALVRADEARVLNPPQGVPLGAYLGVLGGTGLSAYVALTQVAKIKPGEDVFISAAAGGVGSAAGQFAKLLGAGRVIGATGSATKAEHLVKNLGFDAAFNYHDGPVAEQLSRIAPDGVDVCLENVGGDHLEGAIGALREFGRIAWCGAISQYNSTTPPPAPRNLFDMVEKSIRLEGFLVANHRHRQAELEEFAVPHLQSGQLVADETIVEGFDKMIDGFFGMLRGENTGKMIVRAAA